MKNGFIILILILGICLSGLAQGSGFNSPVIKSANLSCTVITKLSIDPLSTKDYVCWPTIPIGSKYTLGESNRQNADFNSIFTFAGEPGSSIQISIVTQTIVDNVEISFSLKGTPYPYLGIQEAPLLTFTDGRAIVNLSAEGEFYLHIGYDWVWAHDNATRGVKKFTQMINAQYFGL